ncbi:MAG: hypothetical protein ACFFAN_14195 [Promethearchaeota archaeon]
MNLETLKCLLDLPKRQELYYNILDFLENLDELDYFVYEKFKISEEFIPVLYIGDNFNLKKVKYVKIFVGAQHNEYNGLFGILEYLNLIKKQKISIKEILLKNQILIFFPLMNPYGFLNPSKLNKSGYYLKNGTNLNRFWRRTFAPEFNDLNDDYREYPIPEHAKIIKKILKKYWIEEDVTIYLLDFHETSLLEKFPLDLIQNLSLYYKFDHFLKEVIIKNIIKIDNIKYYRKPLFFKCIASADHKHISLTIKQLETVHEKLTEYIAKNKDKLPFFFSYSDRSKKYCQRLAFNVYNKLKDKLWKTYYFALEHFHDHGCFVKMADATTRKNFYSMELESEKQIFDLFEEIEKSKTNPNYFENKLNYINLSLELAVETIKEMTNLF